MKILENFFRYYLDYIKNHFIYIFFIIIDLFLNFLLINLMNI